MSICAWIVSQLFSHNRGNTTTTTTTTISTMCEPRQQLTVDKDSVDIVNL